MIDVLDHLVAEGTADVVLLLTSELVTNACLHAGTDTHVTVRLLPDIVRVEVVDGDAHVPAPREAAPEEPSGRGLMILDALSDRWGVDRLDEGGKRVWCEVARSRAS